MDFLIFWVTLAIVVEGTRMAIRKCCVPRKKEKGNSSLREPLLTREELLYASGRCQLSCCSQLLATIDYSQEDFQEEYCLETSEEESDSLGSLRVITDDSEEDCEEQGLKTIKWEDLRKNVSVSLVGDRTSLKGKEIVEELEDDTPDNDRPRSEIVPSRIRRESRGVNSTKIHPEPLHPPLTSLVAPDFLLTHAGQSSCDDGLQIYDQSSWDHHFKADHAKSPTVTGECSKS